MQNFLKTLISEEKNEMLPAEFDFFGGLIGSWRIDYVDNSNGRAIAGEWHFARILEGMAIQDVIILPDYECGTTVRVYNPGTHAWDVAYCYTGKIIRLQARKEEGMIVLTDIDNKNRKWVFAKIEDDSFHWQDVKVTDSGEWHVSFDIFATRMA